jgi:hypothetical protein
MNQKLEEKTENDIITVKKVLGDYYISLNEVVNGDKKFVDYLKQMPEKIDIYFRILSSGL